MNISKNLAIIVSSCIISLGSMVVVLASNGDGVISKITSDNKGTYAAIEMNKDTAMETLHTKNYIAPNVNYGIESGKILLKWDKLDSEELLGYKIVISKCNRYPKYPEDGYLTFIQDKDKTSYLIDNITSYNNGDFGDKLIEGEKYFFSVTACYKDKFVQGNSLELTIPKPEAPKEELKEAPKEIPKEIPKEEPKEEVKPLVIKPAITETKVTGNIEGSGIRLKWTKTSQEKFKYYKVVISKSNANPAYPKDGYLTYISNNEATSYLISPGKCYNGGDLGGVLKEGETYYFSITACYEGANYPGTAVKLTFPANAAPQADNTQLNSVVTAKTEGNNIRLNWTKTNAEDFSYYKVVISKNNPNPAYPEDGNLVCITNNETTTYLIDNKTKYNCGDFGGYLKPGESYYFSVTAVYNNKKIKGTAVKFQFPVGGYSPAKQNYTSLNIKGQIVDGKVLLTWDKNNDEGFNGYKLVISKSNATPVYPKDGYMYWLTDRNKTSATVSAGNTYNCGDFGGKLVSGCTYYFSITSVYNDAKIAGKVISITVP